MFGSNVRATRSIPRHDDVLAIALTPSSYQTLRAPMCSIASAKASSASAPAHSQTRGRARRSTASEADDQLDDRVDCTTRDVRSPAPQFIRGVARHLHIGELTTDGALRR